MSEVELNPIDNIVSAAINKDMINLQKVVNAELMNRANDQIDAMRQAVAGNMAGVEQSEESEEESYDQIEVEADADDVEDYEDENIELSDEDLEAIANLELSDQDYEFDETEKPEEEQADEEV